MSFEQGLKLALEVGREAARLAPDAESHFGSRRSHHEPPRHTRDRGGIRQTDIYQNERRGVAQPGSSRNYSAGNRLGAAAGFRQTVRVMKRRKLMTNEPG